MMLSVVAESDVVITNGSWAELDAFVSQFPAVSRSRPAFEGLIADVDAALAGRELGDPVIPEVPNVSTEADKP